MSLRGAHEEAATPARKHAQSSTRTQLRARTHTGMGISEHAPAHLRIPQREQHFERLARVPERVGVAAAGAVRVALEGALAEGGAELGDGRHAGRGR